MLEEKTENVETIENVEKAEVTETKNNFDLEKEMAEIKALLKAPYIQ